MGRHLSQYASAYNFGYLGRHLSQYVSLGSKGRWKKPPQRQYVPWLGEKTILPDSTYGSRYYFLPWIQFGHGENLYQRFLGQPIVGSLGRPRNDRSLDPGEGEKNPPGDIYANMSPGIGGKKSFPTLNMAGGLFHPGSFTLATLKGPFQCLLNQGDEPEPQRSTRAHALSLPLVRVRWQMSCGRHRGSVYRPRGRHGNDDQLPC